MAVQAWREWWGRPSGLTGRGLASGTLTVTPVSGLPLALTDHPGPASPTTLSENVCPTTPGAAYEVRQVADCHDDLRRGTVQRLRAGWCV